MLLLLHDCIINSGRVKNTENAVLCTFCIHLINLCVGSLSWVYKIPVCMYKIVTLSV